MGHLSLVYMFDISIYLSISTCTVNKTITSAEGIHFTACEFPRKESVKVLTCISEFQKMVLNDRKETISQNINHVHMIILRKAHTVKGMG